jgi:PAS domain S-box-containing protein
MYRRWLAFIPIPVSLILIASLDAIVPPSLFYDPGWLIAVTNTIFVGVTGLIVAFVALRNYQATGRIQLLLLGCGVLVFGIGGIAAGLARGLPNGANVNVTVYNTAALAGAIFHFVAALMLLVGLSPEVGERQKGTWLTVGYAGILVFTTLLTFSAVRGMIPPFFIQMHGPTPLRQVILGSADILFAFSFVIFIGTYFRSRDEFLYWYSLALVLTSISLTAFFIQRSVGSPVGWIGRSSQYLAGIYFLVALLAAGRSARAQRTSLDNVLTRSLSSVEEKFRALAENSPDVISRFDKALTYAYINPAGARLMGSTSGAIVGKTVERAGVPEDHWASWNENLRTVLETGRPLDVEEPFSSTHGVQYFQWRYVPEYAADGTIAYVLAVGRDLTTYKRAETDIKEAQKLLERRQVELEAANQELETFAYSVSHDLRAPLRSIDGYSNILLEDYGDKLDAEGQRLLNVVRNSAVKMGRLIDDILAFSRAGRTAMNLLEVDMTEMVRAVIADPLAPAIAGRNITIDIAELPPVRGDRAMLERVWVNLIDNAIKYSAPKPDARVEIGAKVADGETIYFVRDNGVGFDMQYVDKLFGVFQRLHGAEIPGTGIGLAIVKRLVSRHGGRVWAEGKPGEGATFYFTMPTVGADSV